MHLFKNASAISILAAGVCLSGCVGQAVTRGPPIPNPTNPPVVQASWIGLHNGCPAEQGVTLDQNLSTASGLWEFCVYRNGNQLDPGYHYFSVDMDITPGNSQLNNSNDPNVWAKLLSHLDSRATTAAVTMTFSDQSGNFAANAGAVPILTASRQSSGADPKNVGNARGEALLPYSHFTQVGSKWGMSVSYKFGTTDTDAIASSAVVAAKQVLKYYPVGGVIGQAVAEAGPGRDVDAFVSKLFSSSYAPQPVTLALGYDEWASVDHISIYFFDAPRPAPDRPDPNRAVVAQVVLKPRFLPSIYVPRNGQGKLDYSGLTLATGEWNATIPPLGGATSKAFENNKTDTMLPAQLKTADPAVFQRMCQVGPAIFAADDINMHAQDDAIFATYMALTNWGGWLSNSTAACNDRFNDALRQLGLEPFPAEITPKAAGNKERKTQIAVTKKNTTKVKVGLQMDAPDLTMLFNDTVYFRQSETALPDLKANQFVVVPRDDLIGKLKKAEVKFLTQGGHLYDHNGLQSSSVRVKLQLNGKPYTAEVQWDGVNNAAKITGFFIAAA